MIDEKKPVDIRTLHDSSPLTSKEGFAEKPIGDLRELLKGNSQFRSVWIGGKRYEMPSEELPISEVRHKKQERDMDWIEYGKSWDEFRRERREDRSRLAARGTLIVVKHGSRTDELLIGDINELGGTCDDCMHVVFTHTDNPIVVKYKKII